MFDNKHILDSKI